MDITRRNALKIISATPVAAGLGLGDAVAEQAPHVHGTAPAPIVELPPNPISVYGCDPHSYPRRSLDGVTHDSTWLQPNGFIDQCQTASVPRPCYSNGYAGQ